VHWYKFNIADWSLATLHLSLLEEAVYFRLLNHYYDTECPISSETRQVARRLRLEDHQEIVDRILNEFFVQTENFFTHKRCESELKEYRKQAKKSRENGALGGRPKKNNSLGKTQTKPSSNLAGCQQEPSRNPDITLTTNHQPLTTNQEPIDTGGRFAPPSVSECIAEFGGDEREGRKFHAFYESKNWMVGKSKMKKWRAAATGWKERNNWNAPSVNPGQSFIAKHTDTSWAN